MRERESKKRITTPPQARRMKENEMDFDFLWPTITFFKDVKKFRYIFTHRYYKLYKCKVVVKYECVKLNGVLCVLYK